MYSIYAMPEDRYGHKAKGKKVKPIEGSQISAGLNWNIEKEATKRKQLKPTEVFESYSGPATDKKKTYKKKPDKLKGFKTTKAGYVSRS